MITSSDNLDADTLVSMELDPELMFFTWKVGVENYAANKATIVEPTGLLSSILTDPEWNACLLNRATSPGGTLHIAPIPAPPTHVPITNAMAMKSPAIAVAKYSNDRHQIWHDALATFKIQVQTHPEFGAHPRRHNRATARWFQESLGAANRRCGPCQIRHGRSNGSCKNGGGPN